MKNNKMKIAELKVKSFVTLANDQKNQIKGGGPLTRQNIPVCRRIRK